MSNAEIAAQLGLAEKTVKHYMTGVLTKLHVSSRVEAAVVAHKTGLAGDPGIGPARSPDDPERGTDAPQRHVTPRFWRSRSDAALRPSPAWACSRPTLQAAHRDLGRTSVRPWSHPAVASDPDHGRTHVPTLARSRAGGVSADRSHHAGAHLGASARRTRDRMQNRTAHRRRSSGAGGAATGGHAIRWSGRSGCAGDRGRGEAG